MASVAEPSAPRRRPWEEANPWISGLLAYAIPGAGHLYQGRVFKGLIYLVCIHMAFFTGMCLGEGMTVHYKVQPHAHGWRRISLSYVAQFGTGVWALPAVLQARRVESQHNVSKLSGPLTSSYRGVVKAVGPGSKEFEGPLIGTIRLEPGEPDVHGKFTGTLDGEPFELALSGRPDLEKPIGASSGRGLKIRVARRPDDHPNLDLELIGTIPRPLWNWYEVPPDTDELKEITGRLGKYFELALVFTWIAGLLNVLAIWDCVQGPSLGYGDEQPVEKEAEAKDAGKSSAKPPEPAVPVAAKEV